METVSVSLWLPQRKNFLFLFDTNSLHFYKSAITIWRLIFFPINFQLISHLAARQEKCDQNPRGKSLERVATFESIFPVVTVESILPVATVESILPVVAKNLSLVLGTFCLPLEIVSGSDWPKHGAHYGCRAQGSGHLSETAAQLHRQRCLPTSIAQPGRDRTGMVRGQRNDVLPARRPRHSPLPWSPGFSGPLSWRVEDAPVSRGKFTLQILRARLIDWLIYLSFDWLIDWFIVRLIDWLIECLILIDWLIECLIDWFIVWLIDWLIDWLISCKQHDFCVR